MVCRKESCGIVVRQLQSIIFLVYLLYTALELLMWDLGYRGAMLSWSGGKTWHAVARFKGRERVSSDHEDDDDDDEHNTRDPSPGIKRVKRSRFAKLYL